ncbi:hypothetical protein [Peribacillus asahii]|uniref:ParM/StbA family protein n=1 Tax=Peribacillus asahii TaxID=228899 RepID=UPI003801AD6B
MNKKSFKLPFDRVVGVDLGNGFVKVRGLTNGGIPYTLTLPSCFAYLRDVGDEIGDEDLDLDTFLIDGVEYVWGEDINELEAQHIVHTSGYDNRYKSDNYKIMVQIVLSRIAKDLEIGAREKILLVTGVPSGESGTEKENEIYDAFSGKNEGSYRIPVNGEDQVFKLEKIVVDSQALATIKGRYLDTDGTVLNDKYEKWNVAVIDIGAGTTDLDIVNKLRRQKVNHSVQKGFRDIYNGIRDEINKVYVGHTVTDYELLNIIELTKFKRKESGDDSIPFLYTPSEKKKPVDFTKAFFDGIKEVSVATQEAIVDKWKSQAGLDEILLVGASAEEFKEHLQNVSYIIEIPENNTNSNVEGYYRFGVALNKAMAKG